MNLNKEALKEAIKLKVVSSMHFRIHCKSFFNKKGKKAMRKFSGINVYCTYRVHFLLMVRNHFDKNLIDAKVQVAKIMVK